MIQHLVTPTNADKTFYAKAVVPYEYTGAIRDAWDDEVCGSCFEGRSRQSA